MNMELKTITPQKAGEMLKRNNKNRTISKLHVKRLANEIRSGRWKVNGDTICLNGDVLIDGQHRLHAIIEAGMPIQSFVVDGLPSDVFDTKDTGKRRSHHDTLSVLGKKNTTRLASMLKIIDKYNTGKSNKTVYYSNGDIEELLKLYYDAEESLTNIKTKGLMPPALLDACHYLFSKKDPQLADEFVSAIIKGVGLYEDSPWYRLRERLETNRWSRSKLDKTYIMALCIKSWNAARSGKKVKYLRWKQQGENGEAFPTIQ